jgi:hypothetical protein
MDIYVLTLTSTCSWLRVHKDGGNMVEMGDELEDAFWVDELEDAFGFHPWRWPLEARRMPSVIVIETQDGLGSQIHFNGFRAAFFDLGEDLNPLQIKQRLVEKVKAGHTEVRPGATTSFAHFKFYFASDSAPEELLYYQALSTIGLPYRLVSQVGRAWKNTQSAEVILTTGATFPESMVYPFCKVAHGKVSDFVHTFHVGKPREFDFDAVDRLIEQVKALLGDDVSSIYVGCLGPQARPNIYFQKDGGSLGHCGIVVVPSLNLFEEYEKTGIFSRCPPRIPLTEIFPGTTRVRVLGMIPVFIDNPEVSSPMTYI